MADFKRISNTELVEAPAENDNLVLISNGVVKQVSAAVFAASAGGGGVEPIYLITSREASTSIPTYLGDYTMEDGSAPSPDLYSQFTSGTPIMIKVTSTTGTQITMRCISVYQDSYGGVCLVLYDMLKRELVWVGND